MDLRIGQGFDVHAFADGRKLILCGEEIPSDRGLAGHSDADVAIHALMDALLGAAALGDIGMWFPDSDSKFKNIDSGILLKNILASDRFAPYEICNCDLTLIAQKPKLAPWREKMRDNLAGMLGMAKEKVSVKFTTTEKLGFTGREEGIAAGAVVLLCRKD